MGGVLCPCLVPLPLPPSTPPQSGQGFLSLLSPPLARTRLPLPSWLSPPGQDWSTVTPSPYLPQPGQGYPSPGQGYSFPLLCPTRTGVSLLSASIRYSPNPPPLIISRDGSRIFRTRGPTQTNILHVFGATFQIHHVSQPT